MFEHPLHEHLQQSASGVSIRVEATPQTAFRNSRAASEWFAQTEVRSEHSGVLVMSFIARAAMAVALLLGVYVLGLSLVGVLGFAVYEGIVHGFAGVLVGKGMLLIVFLVLALGRAVWAAHRLSVDEAAGL